MYRNAKAEMVRAGLTLTQVAHSMKIRPATLCHKLNEKAPITVNQAKAFKRIVNSDKSLEELFESFEEAV